MSFASINIEVDRPHLFERLKAYEWFARREAIPALNWFKTRVYMRTERKKLSVGSELIRYHFANLVGSDRVMPVLAISFCVTALVVIGCFGGLMYQVALMVIWGSGSLVMMASFVMAVIAFAALAIFLFFEMGKANEGQEVTSPARWVQRSPRDERIREEMPPQILALVNHLRAAGHSDQEIGVHELVRDEVVYDPVISTPGFLGLRRYHAIYVGDEVKEIVDF